MTPVFDSNILVDCLKKHQPALDELKSYRQRLISIVTWIEIMVGADTAELQMVTQNFMQDNFLIIGITPEIAAIAADIRRTHRLKLPDAVIWATAQARGTLLITRNGKDFSEDDPSIRVPYRL